jgi:hypothetical protein
VIALIPLVGAIILLVFHATAGDRGSNTTARSCCRSPLAEVSLGSRRSSSAFERQRSQGNRSG